MPNMGGESYRGGEGGLALGGWRLKWVVWRRRRASHIDRTANAESTFFNDMSVDLGCGYISVTQQRLNRSQVDIFYPQAKTFRNSQARAIHQAGHQRIDREQTSDQ